MNPGDDRQKCSDCHRWQCVVRLDAETCLCTKCGRKFPLTYAEPPRDEREPKCQ
jgi:hypothetical protein